MVLKKLHSQSHAGGFWAPFCMYVGISLLYASVAGSLVSFVEPLAAGSGIAEVKTYLNGIHIRGLLTVGGPESFRRAAHLPIRLGYLRLHAVWCCCICHCPDYTVAGGLCGHLLSESSQGRWTALRVVSHVSVAAWVSCGPICKRMLCSTKGLTFLNRPFLGSHSG